MMQFMFEKMRTSDHFIRFFLFIEKRKIEGNL